MNFSYNDIDILKMTNDHIHIKNFILKLKNPYFKDGL